MAATHQSVPTTQQATNQSATDQLTAPVAGLTAVVAKVQVDASCLKEQGRDIAAEAGTRAGAQSLGEGSHLPVALLLAPWLICP